MVNSMSQTSRKCRSRRSAYARSSSGHRRQPLVEDGDGFRGVGAGHDVLALGPEEDVAVERVLAGGRVAREEDAGRRIRSPVAEDHGLHDDRRAEVSRDALSLAVGCAPGRCPRSGRRPRRRRAAAARGRPARCHADDVAVHRLQAVPAGRREGRVARDAGETLGRGLVQAEVEDRVEHAGHGDRRAGADADQQRVAGVTEGPADPLADARHLRPQLGIQPGSASQRARRPCRPRW